MLVPWDERRKKILLRLQPFHNRLPIHLARRDAAETRHVDCALAGATRAHVAVQLQVLADCPPAAEEVKRRLKFRTVRPAAAIVGVPLRRLMPEPRRAWNCALSQSSVMLTLNRHELVFGNVSRHASRDTEVQRQ